MVVVTVYDCGYRVVDLAEKRRLAVVAGVGEVLGEAGCCLRVSSVGWIENGTLRIERPTKLYPQPTAVAPLQDSTHEFLRLSCAQTLCLSSSLHVLV